MVSVDGLYPAIEMAGISPDLILIYDQFCNWYIALVHYHHDLLILQHCLESLIVV